MSEELNNHQIEKIMKGVPNFRGVYSKDTLPDKPNNKESFIVNLQNFFDGEGTHWVAIYKNKNYEYFDSFGLPPPEEIITYCKGDVEYNSIQIQKMNTDLCGYYCIYYIRNRVMGRKPIDILFDFTTKPSEVNAYIVKNFLKVH